MMSLWRPSLVRRMVLALLAAFFVVWCVLIGVDYLEYRNMAQRGTSLDLLARGIVDSLPEEDEVLAVALVRAADMQYNHLRKNGATADVGALQFVLARRDGTQVYFSSGVPPEVAISERLASDKAKFRTVEREHGRWRLMVAEPVIDDTVIVRLLGSELLFSMLIAFPLILIPLWLVVRRGLLPLRRLASEIEGRDPGDFSPLALRLQHAELQPLVTAFDCLLATARQGIERERAFVQDAAHELRTPLAVIDAQAHLLLRSSDPEQVADARRALERAVQRASHLIHQLLTLATLECGNRAGERQGDVVRIARDIVIAATSVATARDIEVLLESPESLELTLDISAFHSVLGNLLDNALSYCPSGSRVVITLCSANYEGRGGVKLSVVDNGPGVSDEEMPRLFERFYRGPRTVTAGSGLGLAIVQQAVKRLGGHLSVARGEKQRGLAVSVWWPNGECATAPALKQ